MLNGLRDSTQPMCERTARQSKRPGLIHRVAFKPGPFANLLLHLVGPSLILFVLRPMKKAVLHSALSSVAEKLSFEATSHICSHDIDSLL